MKFKVIFVKSATGVKLEKANWFVQMNRHRGWLPLLKHNANADFHTEQKQPKLTSNNFNHQEKKMPYISSVSVTLLCAALSTVPNLRGIN